MLAVIPSAALAARAFSARPSWAQVTPSAPAPPRPPPAMAMAASAARPCERRGAVVGVQAQLTLLGALGTGERQAFQRGIPNGGPRPSRVTGVRPDKRPASVARMLHVLAQSADGSVR